jgi:hypothetical protein
MCNDNSQFSYSMRDAQISTTEKLFEILSKLSSIRATAEVRGESEQFILGVLASAEVVEGAINGVSNKNTLSIHHPDQIPLI